MKQLTILTNDPSLTGWGYCVITNNKIIDCGCIKTKSENKKRRIRKGDDNTRRINEIVNSLLSVIDKHKVNYILSELPHGSQSASAAIMIGITTGITQTIANCLSISIEWYSEADSKKALLNKRSATKQETIDAISKIYGDVWKTGIKYKDEAIADAISIYHVARRDSSTIKMFNQLK